MKNKNVRSVLLCRSRYEFVALVCLAFSLLMFFTTVKVGNADNFTDIFYTNSFRGAFTWVKKLDWVGMLVQIVISCFSLFGVALLAIRIMTSMLYLSSKGMWEEVHDLKSSGGDSNLYDFGMLNMAKSWAQGKAGTGLDAIIGAVLILLPDVKKYSDFGEKAGGKFEEDITITQYVLKIALPSVMIVFFLAMGFNGTLFQFLGVTVDAMGQVADRAVSVNYAGMVDDLINSGIGYTFVFDKDGTNTGKLEQSIAKDVYGRCIAGIKGLNARQLEQIGMNVEDWVRANFGPGGDGIGQATNLNNDVKTAIQRNDDTSDKYMSYLTFQSEVNRSSEVSGAVHFSLDSSGAYANVPDLQSVSDNTRYVHVWIRQTSSNTSEYINTDGVIRP